MDSYEILEVDRDASDKEIEISYEDLKRKYDPNFNTSIRAYTKYREILKAYENIKNDTRRKMYDLKDDEKIKENTNVKYVLYDYSTRVETIKEEVINYNSLEEVEELVKEDIVINKKISYLYFLLNLKVDLSYSRKVNCSECSSFVKCPLCEGKGVVYYREKQVYCPKCHGKGEVSEKCTCCNDKGYYEKEEKFSVFVDDEKMIFNDLGDEYYDSTKSNLVVNFDFYDKDNIIISDDIIRVNYYLNEEETRNGICREYYSENGAFRLEVDSFIEDKSEKEIVFNNKKIIFVFYNKPIDGNDLVRYLFINRKYKNKFIYFNNDYSKCSICKDQEYKNSIEVKGSITLDGFGESGIYGGKTGALIINCIFNNKKDIDYLSNVEILETSKMFNLLGGRVKDVYHYGFRGQNSLIKKGNNYYLLSGKEEVKHKMKNYFVFKVVVLMLLMFIPCLMFFIPYSESLYILLISLLLGYLILSNLIMEVKI